MIRNIRESNRGYPSVPRSSKGLTEMTHD